jgi:hypothetical protein
MASGYTNFVNIPSRTFFSALFEMKQVWSALIGPPSAVLQEEQFFVRMSTDNVGHNNTISMGTCPIFHTTNSPEQMFTSQNNYN